MRHLFRTHRVALDWMFDRINLDPKIQIKYIDTKHQLGDILTKGISHVTSGTIFFICSTSATSALSLLLSEFQPDSLHQNDVKKDARTGENRIVAKSKPTTMNLAFIVSTSSLTEQNLVASKSLGILKAPCRTDWSSAEKLDARENNQDVASSSQGWQKAAVLDVGTRKLRRDRRRPRTLELS